MERTPVQSSQIASIGYDAEKREMEIEFHGKKEAPGDVYRYYDVAPGTYQQMIAAKSIGSFFGKEVRGQYTYKKMDQSVDAAVKEITQRISKLDLTKEQADTLIDAVMAQVKE
jgi:hypothetical protein